MWLWLMRIATQYQLMMSMGNPRQCGNASGATWWPKLTLMQVEKSLRKKVETSFKIKVEKKLEKKIRKKAGKKTWKQVKNIARGTTDPGYWVRNLNDLSQPKWFQIDFSQKHDSSYRLNTLGPLCLWQCFLQRSDFSRKSFFSESC